MQSKKTGPPHDIKMIFKSGRKGLASEISSILEDIENK